MGLPVLSRLRGINTTTSVGLAGQEPMPQRMALATFENGHVLGGKKILPEGRAYVTYSQHNIPLYYCLQLLA